MSKFLSGTGKSFTSTLFPRASDSSTLQQCMIYLIKSQIMSVRTISNYRSLLAFLLANN